MNTFIDWLVDYLKEEDNDPFILDKNDVLEWVRNIQNELISDEIKKQPWIGKHYGDCIKENVACQFCMYQTWLEKYEDYCRNYKKEE